MGFESLLGNARLKENLTGAVRRGRISHFYLISGPEGSGKRMLARLLAAAALCQGENKPCMRCNACRKVMGGTHPDVITVTDPEHKAVAVKIIREARDSVFIPPNEGEKKVYIFPQEMGIEGQNALLKILEEPPAYGVFLLLSTNPEALLPTIRSRCTELSLQALSPTELAGALAARFPEKTPEARDVAATQSGGYLGQAEKLLTEQAAFSPETERFAKAFTERDSGELTLLLCAMEKWKRDRFIPEMEAWSRLLRGALVCRNDQGGTSAEKAMAAARSARELMSAYEEIQKAIAYAQGNISVATLCGNLMWALR